MPTLDSHGLRIWYGTDDAPAPTGSVPSGSPVVVRIGAQPDGPQLTITVRYRRQAGTWMVLKALPVGEREGNGARYFDATFPSLAPGTSIEYAVQCQRDGKVVDLGPVPTLTFSVTSGAARNARSNQAIGATGTDRSAAASATDKAAKQGAAAASAIPPSVLAAARVAGLAGDTATRLAHKMGSLPLLDAASAGELVAGGALTDAEAGKLQVAALAIDLSKGNESGAARLMTELEGRGVRQPQDLVQLRVDDLTASLDRSGVASGQQAAAQAAELRAAVSKAYPTQALPPDKATAVTKIRTGGQSTPIKQEVIAAAWKNNAGLDLLRLDLSRSSADRQKLNLSGLATAERKAFIRDLQVRKSAVRAAGNADVAEKLLSAGIKAPGKTAPGRLADVTGISLPRAERIHKRDLQHFGRLSHGLFALIDAHSGGLQNLAVGNLRRNQIVDFVRGSQDDGTFDRLDNIEQLFGNLDSCNCKHCNSILGPAAYFVDLMHFVRTHVLDDEIAEGGAESDPPFKGKQNHRLHLRTRRPDLWTLPLTCENTHTEIPQLQITGEIFENYIASRRGTPVGPDRAGVLKAVYGTLLPEGRHSVAQPFHLPMEEQEIYLQHFGIRRADIAEALGEPEEACLRAVLGLSRVHADLITSADASAVNIQNKLGLSVPADGVLPTKALLKATQLSRDDLGEILLSRFVGGSQPLAIRAEKKSADSVQFDIERVYGVSLDHLDRLHRLMRLKRRLPWSPRELDAFVASSSGTLDAATLADAGRAVLLKERFKATAQELCALAGQLPQIPIERKSSAGSEQRSAFDVLFNIPDLKREDGDYPDASLRCTPSETTAAAIERRMRLRAGLRLDEAELAALIEGLSHAFQDGTVANAAGLTGRFLGQRLRALPRPALPASVQYEAPAALPVASVSAVSFPLNAQNLTLLYRHAVLGRWLKLSVSDLLTLIRLTPDVGNHVANLRDTLAVLRFYDEWRTAGLGLDDLTLLLAPSEALEASVRDLWFALQAWAAEDVPATLSDTFLTRIEGINEDLARRLVSANLGKVFETVDAGVRVRESSRLTDLDLSLLQGTTVDAKPVQQLVAHYLPEERLPRALTQALKLHIDQARTMVAAALGTDHEQIVAGLSKPGPLEARTKPFLEAILRLHRATSELKLAPATLTFVAEHSAAFGVTGWNEPAPKAIERIAAVQALLRRRFLDDPTPALAQLRLLAQGAELLPVVATSLLGIEGSVAREVAGSVSSPENSLDKLVKLERCAELVIRLGIGASALVGIVSEDHAASSAAAEALIAGFRSKYVDEKTWTEKFEPYQERVLEKKRDALIDFLLHGPNAEFEDASEMYKYFLIDGEVDGCFRTSRVVAASSSLQLYVHRIRMNLEKEPGAGLHVKPALIPEEEWDWRKHYRVWEANRKIFLWPENYLDPTIRDDKTPLFEELESELLQQEVTEQAVIDAYSKYLRGLEELANLRYAGSFHHFVEDDESGEVTDVLYLFAATGGEAPAHYWREVRNLARGQDDELVSTEHGPWKKVDTRIPVRHVSPIVSDGRLRVFWNEITTTSRNAVNDGNSRFIGYSHRYSLKFTELRLDGQWTPADAISLKGSAATFVETDSSVDDPLAEGMEVAAFREALFANFMPWFGTYSGPVPNLEDAQRRLLIPRWGSDGDIHTKAREGYTVDGFMWDRPYVSADPAYGDRLLVNCAGLMVRGAVDLFDRQVFAVDDTRHEKSPVLGTGLIAYRWKWVWIGADRLTARGAGTLLQGSPEYSLLLRTSRELSQVTWAHCPFDYPVAAEIALNSEMLSVFKRHWGRSLDWSAAGLKVADIPADSGVWVVGGSPSSVVIETESDLLFLQPSARAANHYVLHRLGTTLATSLSRKLFVDGVDGLLSAAYQMGLAEPTPGVAGPRTTDSTVRNPVANNASFGIYYQEIFQHIPLLIAHHLNARGKFEHAQRWYHHVFDPTSPEPPNEAVAPAADRNWKYRQFRGQEQVKLREILGDTAAIQKYRQDPFNAHAIARLRVSAYQKAVVMRYIDNLLDWADDRFTRFQMETVNEAMALYVTAAEVLGPRPIQLGECGELSDAGRTYSMLADAIGKDGDFLLEVEQLMPQSTSIGSSVPGQPVLKPVFGLKGLLAFPLIELASEQSGAATTARGGATSRVAVGGGSRDTLQFVPKLPEVKGGMRGLSKGAVHDQFELALARLTRPIAAQPQSDDSVQSFSRRQQFVSLGGQWKVNGGRRVQTTLGDRFGRAMARQATTAFCIPRNEILEGYWDRVEDRIQKIRSCRDITGRKRKLSLFAPPIDPMLLARARAAGLALDDALAAFDGAIPQYRFSHLMQKAKEFTGTVQSFGSALQAALERRDAEELTRIQSTQQQQILALTTKAKQWELASAQVNLDATIRRKIAVENRRTHYADLVTAGLNGWETIESIGTHTASTILGTAAAHNFFAAVLGLVPQLGSPFAMTYGGDQFQKGASRAGAALGQLADLSRNVASSAGLEARNARRSEDWKFQRDQSADELTQVEKQIKASEIACDIADHAIKVHEKNIEHNDYVLEYHRDKFSNLGLYTWLSSELQRSYREAFAMADRMARYAEQAYRFEREDYDTELLGGQYWDASRAGLLAGNRLVLGLQQLEQRYIETDLPKREIVEQHFSLRQWDPVALMQLRQKGECKFEVPELMFDLMSPGDYRRRLRSVRITIPAVAGPNINIMATLSLDSSQIRYAPNWDLQDAPRPRQDSITTSSARNDAGVFELNFRGEKYVPFEGAGAVSKWSLSLPAAVRMFDYSTITDVVLHLDYTASFDGMHREVVEGFSKGIVSSLQSRLAEDGVVRAFNLKEEFATEYRKLIAGEATTLKVTPDHLPFFMRSAEVAEASLVFAGFPAGEPALRNVEVDGVSVGTPSFDEALGASALSLGAGEPGAISRSIRIGRLSGGAAANLFLLLVLRSSV